MLFEFFDKIITKIISGHDRVGNILNFAEKNIPIFNSDIKRYLKIHQEAKPQISRGLSAGQPTNGVMPFSSDHFRVDYLTIILTHQCNLNCTYCLRSAVENPAEPEIDFKTLEQIILTAHRAGCRSCGLTGGEPLLYSKFKELVGLLSFLDWTVLIETNGKILTADLCNFLKEKLKDRLSMFVCLNGPRKEFHDILRGKGNFDLAIKTIKLIKSYDIKLFTNAVLTTKNLMTEKDLLDFVSFNKNLKVDLVHINRVVPQGRGKNKELLLSTIQTIEFNRILEKYQFFDNFVSRGSVGPNQDLRGRGCERMRHDICVSPTGLHPCIFHEEIKIGNLTDFKNVIWKEDLRGLMASVQRAAFYDYHKKGFPFSCAECVYKLPKLLNSFNKIK